MNKETTKSEAAERKEHVRNIFVVEASVHRSRIRGVRMRTTLAGLAAYFTGILLTKRTEVSQYESPCAVGFIARIKAGFQRSI